MTVNSVDDEKNLIRKKILCLRDELTADYRLEKSRYIQARLQSLPNVKRAANVFIYVSFRSEVYTHEMIREMLAAGKGVIVPVTDMKNKKLILSRITDFNDDLAPGTMGILEPRPEKISLVQAEEIDVVITPGAVFCEEGWRIGYGGGFYDRFLRESGKCSCGLAFDMQITGAVAHDPRYDVAVDYIVTESRIINCEGPF